MVLSVKWNQNGNWVLTASKDQIIKVGGQFFAPQLSHELIWDFFSSEIYNFPPMADDIVAPHALRFMT